RRSSTWQRRSAELREETNHVSDWEHQRHRSPAWPATRWHSLMASASRRRHPRLPVRNSYWLSENLPNAVLITYPDSGHGWLCQFHHHSCSACGGSGAAAWARWRHHLAQRAYFSNSWKGASRVSRISSVSGRLIYGDKLGRRSSRPLIRRKDITWHLRSQ